MSTDAALSAYLTEAASWDVDRRRQARRDLKLAWAVAFTGWVFALVSAATLLLLLPLKRVEPYVIRVDNSSGLVDVVPAYAGTAPLPESVTRYFLAHYITVCERFNHATAESDYAECGAFQSAQMNQAWSLAWARGNPDSPLNRYKDGSTVRAQVRSVSFFTRASGLHDLAQVRYWKAKRTAGGGEEEKSYWIATIQYLYAKPSKKLQQRQWNPLGFRILAFHPEPEVPGDPERTGAPVAPVTASAGAPPTGSSR